MSALPVIEIEDLYKDYTIGSGRKATTIPVLREISLRIEEGEFVSILGPTGCGKTTLLHIISRLTEPTAGVVRINGGDRNLDVQAEIGMVFQSPGLLPWFRVDSNILLPLVMGNGSKKAARGRLEYLLRLVNLQDFAHAYPHQLSVGMKQKVSLCRALIRRPKVLLMDEPFSALDALTREHLDLELSRIWNEERTTTIFVTHSISEAVLLSDRVVIMSERPASVVAIIPIELERPRTESLFQSPTFAHYQKEVRAVLNENRVAAAGATT